MSVKKSFLRFFSFWMVAVFFVVVSNAEKGAKKVDDFLQQEKISKSDSHLKININNNDSEFTSDEMNILNKQQESFEFKSDTSKLLEILINSIYKEKDIFLREMISNASDAINKIRFETLTNPEVLGEGELSKLEIHVKVDKKKRVVYIRDTGIGMTKEELISSLGNLAQSGTQKFLEQIEKGQQTDDLIGKFGVGFYSVFLVSNSVEVVTKSNNDDQYFWRCVLDKKSNKPQFFVSKDPRGNTLGRGTLIAIRIKEGKEYERFLDQDEIRKIIKKYSKFIDHPIYLNVVFTSKKQDTEGGDKEDQENAEEAKKENEDVSLELLNSLKAIWTKNKNDVKHEEYLEFYKTLATRNLDNEPEDWLHFHAEGTISFKCIIYIPDQSKEDFEILVDDHVRSVKLYAKKVFITDDFLEDLIPRYYAFVRGVVDAENIDLSLNRDQIQKSHALFKIKNILTRKITGMMRKLQKKYDERGAMGDFWNKYGQYIKTGAMRESIYRHRIKIFELLNYKTTETENKYLTIKDYVRLVNKDFFKEKEQDKLTNEDTLFKSIPNRKVYFLGGFTEHMIINSPHLEYYIKNKIPVMILNDPNDEYVFHQLSTLKYLNLEYIDISKTEDEDDDKKEETDVEWESFIKFIHKNNKSRVINVITSDKLSTIPCVAMSQKMGMSPNFERIVKTQYYSKSNFMLLKKIYKPVFMINTKHPLIIAMNNEYKKNPDSKRLLVSIKLLVKTALLESGYEELRNPNEFTEEIYRSLASLHGANEEEVSELFLQRKETLEKVDYYKKLMENVAEKERAEEEEAQKARLEFEKQKQN